MTGDQGLIVFAAGPVLGLLAARLLGHTSLLSILSGALLGEGVAVLAALAWSRRLLHVTVASQQASMVAIATNVSLANRLWAIGILALGALAIGGLGFLVLRSAGGLEA